MRTIELSPSPAISFNIASADSIPGKSQPNLNPISTILTFTNTKFSPIMREQKVRLLVSRELLREGVDWCQLHTSIQATHFCYLVRPHSPLLLLVLPTYSCSFSAR